MFFFPGIISMVNIFVFGGSVSARQITYGYSIDDVSTTKRIAPSDNMRPKSDDAKTRHQLVKG